MTDGPRDWAQYLPLSNRPRRDERGVGFDWRAELEGLMAQTGGTPAAEAALRRSRVRVADYGDVLADALASGAAPELPAAVSGAVALARVQRASHAVRAVIRGRTLRATDAGWEFGSGPALEGTAAELVLFLYGRAGLPGS